MGAVNRSLIRSQRLDTIMYTDITSSGSGEYLMRLGLGTPPVEFLGFADTGSSLIWTQCEPCTKCFKQPHPIFDPKASASFRDIGCHWGQCQNFSSITSCGPGNACMYKQSYLDGSISRGILVSETLTIGTHTLPGMLLGCGHENSVLAPGGAGIIGLNMGDLSLLTQLDQDINGLFSYCFAPHGSSRRSGINLGLISSHVGGVTTSYTSNPDTEAYYLTLEAVSVAGTRLEFPGSADGEGDGEGNIALDTGTVLTFLPVDFHSQMLAELEKVVKAEKAPTDKTGGLSNCYMMRVVNEATLPEIQLHFKGADVKLKPENSFPRMTRDIVCFGFFGSGHSPAIMGNMAQTNFVVEYDRHARTVSFVPHECG
ncbi:PREDICTED: aspartic proteinase CDR1-like [Tarenaya hassleriana]|uniref:aspartic proteinase CDR1-like n=1 Tax=Tarenaya hassleriana TaxID=28532 RepID=UPI00053C6DDC|nr:PREDICTED: aspartic proteinase CDR1-like [Tarenaya hassleriana]